VIGRLNEVPKLRSSGKNSEIATRRAIRRPNPIKKRRLGVVFELKPESDFNRFINYGASVLRGTMTPDIAETITEYQ